MSSGKRLNSKVLFEPPSLAQKYLPEGIQLVDKGRLGWVNIQNGFRSKRGSLNFLDLDTHEFVYVETPGRVGFLFPTTSRDHFLVGCENHVGLFDIVKQKFATELFRLFDMHPETVINDAIMFEYGIVIGTKDQRVQRPIGACYFLSFSDGSITQLLDDQICSNGKVLVQCGADWFLYDIDSPSKQVLRHTLKLGFRRSIDVKILQSDIHLDLTDLDGCPDGMTITPDKKSLVVAIYNGDANARDGQARQYNIESGKLERVFEFPGAPRVTCPAFFVYKSEVLLGVTTAVEADEQGATTLLKNAPNSGCVMFSRTEFKDMPQIVQYDPPSRGLHVFPSQ